MNYAVYIIMDLLLLIAILVVLCLIFKNLNKNRTFYTNAKNYDLDNFRNPNIYEVALSEKRKYAHIEEVAAFRNFPDSKQEEESDD
mgnify:CR=1 FL=1